MRKFLTFAVLMSAVAFMAGWHQANTNLEKVSSQSDNWDSLNEKRAIKFKTNILAESLKAGSLFPNSFEEEQAIKGGESGASETATDIPEFPKIVSVGYRDGKPIVILRNVDSKLVSAVPGDVLETGWQIETVDLSHVIAVLDGQAQEFSVVQYERVKDREDAQRDGGK